MTSLKDLILAAEDIPFEDIEIPEWGGVTVRLKGLSDADMAAYQARTMKFKMQTQNTANPVDLEFKDDKAFVVSKCLRDPETDALLFDSEAGVKQLMAKSANVINTLYTVAVNMTYANKSFEDKVEDAKKG